MSFYGKILTSKDSQESELIKAASIMALFRYLSESDTEGEEPITADIIKEMTGLDVK